MAALLLRAALILLKLVCQDGLDELRSRFRPTPQGDEVRVSPQMYATARFHLGFFR